MTLIIKENNQPTATPTSKPMGGTEILHQELLRRIPTKFWNDINLIVSKLTEGSIVKNKKNVLWVHDNINDPMVDLLRNESIVNKLDLIAFVSHWQMNQFIGNYNLPHNKCKVIKNAIIPIDMGGVKKNDVCTFAYISTPHRGLDVLYSAVQILTNLKQDFKVDICSSFSIYGWDEMQKKNQHIFNQIAEHPNINFHGQQSHENVIEIVKKSHCLAYPCTYQETYCLSMIEAMSAMNYVICPSLGALPETSSGFAQMYTYLPDKSMHAELIAQNMFYFINTRNSINAFLKLQKTVIDSQNSWDIRGCEWQHILEGLL